MPGPQPNATVIDRPVLEAEVARIVDGLDGRGVPLRVLGSLGVSLHCPGSAALLPAFDRTYADIDFAGYRRHAESVAAFLGERGYLEDREVSIATEGRRGLFDHPHSRIHIDVFYDRLEFCHPIPLDGRLEGDRPTLPLAELLLSKLQIVQINEKDVIDVVLLLLDHPLGTRDEDTIDASRLARLCARDWGLWRTTTLNLGKVRTLSAGYPQLDEGRRARVAAQIDALVAVLDAEPKSLRWRTRARVGDRLKWWADVEEVRA